nr:DUF2807 domain-containing protein [Prevotella sp.]
MKKIYSKIFAVAFLLTTGCLCSCIKVIKQSPADSKYTDKNYHVNDFQTLEVHGNVELYLIKGNAAKVVIKGKTFDIKNYKVEQNGNTLSIGQQSKGSNIINFGSSSNAKIYVCAPNLKNINVSGNSEIQVQEPIKAKSFNANISGNSEVNLHLYKVTNSVIDLSGNSDMTIQYDSCYHSVVDVSGNSDIALNGTLKKKLEIDSGGNSDFSNNVTYLK